MESWLAPSQLTWSGADGDWAVEVHWALVDGRPECVGMSIAPISGAEPRQLTSRVLRSLPLGELTSRARRARYEEHGGRWLEAGPITEHQLADPGDELDLLSAEQL